MFSKQEIFDIVSVALLKQGQKSINTELLNKTGNICAYRGANGCKYAVGHLISDEEYDPIMEGCSLNHPIFEKWLNKNFNFEDVNDFLCELQEIHDVIES
jgi:hypothetical protein